MPPSLITFSRFFGASSLSLSHTDDRKYGIGCEVGGGNFYFLILK